MLKFITGNKNKFEEIQAMLAPLEIEQVDLDLDEIQSLDPHEIIKHKLNQALQKERGEFIVEDTSLYLECLQSKLPGPYVKWFLQSLGAKGIAELAMKMENVNAVSQVIIGYANNGQIKFFEGKNSGTIVEPIGEKDFGWGPIFKPQGQDKTYGEMDREEKYKTSMRALAAAQLKEFLNSK